MIAAATHRRDDPRNTRLLRVAPDSGRLSLHPIGDLAALLRPGDLLVLNDAATLPASLTGTTSGGAAIELRLAAGNEDGSWLAVTFGAGDWRTRTEDRPAPPALAVGARVHLDGVDARVVVVDAASPRFVTLRFEAEGAALWRALYRAGRPVQYAHAAAPLALWDVQTAYGARPWAVEAPSAGFALSWELLLALRGRGVELARITHAAGLSSTGDPRLDARLPLCERFEVTPGAAAAVNLARARGGRIIAAGTTVTRALESAVGQDGAVSPSAGVTCRRLGPEAPPRVVDGLLTGLHDAGTSHYALLGGFVSRELMDRGLAAAATAGCLGHEFGDVALVVPERARRALPAPGIAA